MTSQQKSIAVYPGAFDPFTNGHLDIIRRGSRLFDKLVVAIGRNPTKSEVFSAQERVEMIEEVVRDLPGIQVDSYEGLTMEYVRKVGATYILRGIRDTADLRDELQAANTNLMVGDVETIFLMTSDQHALTSSSLIRQVVELGGYDPQRLARLVPPSVVARLEAKFRR